MITDPSVGRQNVGRLAERIVANELEWRGYRVSDLNKDGLSPDADLVAAAHGRIWQIQVKGASNTTTHPWWIHYGHCSNDIIEGRLPMFNRRGNFYVADLVILVAVQSPIVYQCVTLFVREAEAAAQLNLDRDYRTLTKKGDKKKPHTVFAYLEETPREHTKSSHARSLHKKEREILIGGLGENGWRKLQVA
jgi:hypothetical protein